MSDEIYNDIKSTENLLNAINPKDAVEFAKWIKEKTYLRYKGELPKFPIYNNFIYWCNLGINIGSEQNKLRPALIIKSFKNSPTCAILPLTTKRLNDKFWFHVDMKKVNSTVLVEQIRVVSKLRITNPYRKKGQMVAISQKDLEKINVQLENLYKLRPLKNK